MRMFLSTAAWLDYPMEDLQTGARAGPARAGAQIGAAQIGGPRQPGRGRVHPNSATAVQRTSTYVAFGKGAPKIAPRFCKLGQDMDEKADIVLQISMTDISEAAFEMVELFIMEEMRRLCLIDNGPSVRRLSLLSCS